MSSVKGASHSGSGVSRASEYGVIVSEVGGDIFTRVGYSDSRAA
jgi:hypothetical protein